MAPVSLRDITEQASASLQTVGKALKGERRIALATRQRILDAPPPAGDVLNTVASPRGAADRSTLSPPGRRHTS